MRPDKKSRPGKVTEAAGRPAKRVSNQSTPILGVAVRVGAPTPSRRRWLAVLDSCPSCGQPEVFYSDARRLFGGEATRRCAVTGLRFVLLAADPDAVRDVAVFSENGGHMCAEPDRCAK